MAKRNLPQPFEIDKLRFSHCFTVPSLRHFAVLIVGWVMTIGTHTLSNVVLTTGLHESEHFSNAYRFFVRAKWAVESVSREVFLLIVETFLPDKIDYELVIDDTLNNHVGRKICGAAFQHDGDAPKTGRPVGYGVCFVTIGMVVRLPGMSNRVFCLPYAARLWFPKKTKHKPKGSDYKTKTQLAVELIELTRSWLHPDITLRVIVDGAYSNKTLLMNRPSGVHITGKLRVDAALYAVVEHPVVNTIGRPRLKGDRLPTPKDIFNDRHKIREWVLIRLYGKETIVSVRRFRAIWYKAAGNEPLSVVLVRDPVGDYPDQAYFDTDVTASDTETIRRYSHRWSTEITYRETKSLLGSADCQCRHQNSVLRVPMMAYWSYSLVVIWFVGQMKQGKDLMIQSPPWYGRKTSITFSDMLAAARRSHFSPVISREPGNNAKKPKFNYALFGCNLNPILMAKL